MFDIHVQIDAPDVAEALNRLADALNAQTEVIRGGIPEIPNVPQKKEAKAPEILAALQAIAGGGTDPADTAPWEEPATVKPAAQATPTATQTVIPTGTTPAASMAQVAAAAAAAVPAVTAASNAVSTAAAAAAPAAPAAQKTNVTLNDIKRAGQLLMDAGKMNELLALLRTFGVEALPALKPEQYEAVAAGLRGLGAKI